MVGAVATIKKPKDRKCLDIVDDVSLLQTFITPHTVNISNAKVPKTLKVPKTPHDNEDLLSLNAIGQQALSKHAVQHPHSDHEANDEDAENQILALFPTILNSRARAALKDRGLVNKLTRLMREHSTWDGFKNTNDVSFWRAHQEADHRRDGKPQWWGQPNRFDGTPLVRNHEIDRWFKTSHFITLFDDIPKNEALPCEVLGSAGMNFNHAQGLETFLLLDAYYHWGSPQKVAKVGEPKPLTPYQDPGYNFTFVPYFTESKDQKKIHDFYKRSGVKLDGPGYSVVIMNFFHSNLPFNETESIPRTCVWVNVMLGHHASDAVELIVKNRMRQKGLSDR